jgi:hypothetical protein
MDVKRYGHGLLQGTILALNGGTQENHKKDRQCVYNVTLMEVCITTLAVEKQLVLHSLSVCL